MLVAVTAVLVLVLAMLAMFTMEHCNCNKHSRRVDEA